MSKISPLASKVQPKEFSDLVSISDLEPGGIEEILFLAAQIKARPAAFQSALTGKQLVLWFEKPSLRTRLTFEAGIASMGGTSFFMDQRGSRIDEREKLSDIAHNLERWVHGIILRTFDHATVTGMAEHASIPVINALSNHEHPCQALADFLTLKERFHDLTKVRLAWVGDGNNVAHSLLLTAAATGASMSVATPKGYEPDKSVVASAQALATKSGASVQLLNDPVAAVRGADAVYTDVWASMGQEDEAAARAAVFAPYQVNDQLMAAAGPRALFMHCLPAHRGAEVTDSVMDSPQSVVFDQAENRLHVQKAILLLLLGGGAGRSTMRSAHA
ncbi:MAG: ornithine carbamoyltransferase [Terriglobales bacterium]